MPKIIGNSAAQVLNKRFKRKEVREFSVRTPKLVGQYTGNDGHISPVYTVLCLGELNKTSSGTGTVDLIENAARIISVQGEIRHISGASAGAAFAYPDINTTTWVGAEAKWAHFCRVYLDTTANRIRMQYFDEKIPVKIEYNLYITYIGVGSI